MRFSSVMSCTLNFSQTQEGKKPTICQKKCPGEITVFPITLYLCFEQQSVKFGMKLAYQLQGGEASLGSFMQSQKHHLYQN